MWYSSFQLSWAAFALIQLARASDPSEDYGDHGEIQEEPCDDPPAEYPPAEGYPPCARLCDLPAYIADCEDTLLEEQRAGTEVWAQAYADKDVDTMMSYVVDDYIQHNPNILSGREVALKYITKRLSDPTIINNVTLVITQLNFVMLHVHRKQEGKPDKAMADIYRLDGTCIAEHWDVQQDFEEDPPNPLTFF